MANMTGTTHALPAIDGFVDEKQGGHDASELGDTAAESELRSAAGPISILLVLAGSAMQGYANGTTDALYVAALFLAAGYLAVSLIFPRGNAEHRVFLLTYAICVFAGGLAQCYSLGVFGAVQSTLDANTFFGTIFDKPPYYTWQDLRLVVVDGNQVGRGAELAVAIWQAVYHVRKLLGFDFGPYVGVMFNAFVMALTGAITVRTAREIFGEDSWRLRRIGTLFALCGLFILFGSVFLRDCFTTFFNSLLLWGIVRWLRRPTLRNLLFAGMLTGISIGAMAYLRSRSIVLFGLFWFLALMCWIIAKRLNLARVLACIFILCSLLAGSTYLRNYVQMSRSMQSANTMKYEGFFGNSSQESSLGMRFIINQPLPIRLAFGTSSMMVHPIPLWAYFYRGTDEYHLIKGYHGIYQVFVFPLFFAGFMMSISVFWRDRGQAIPQLFLAIYLVINVLAVVATSLEQRHIGQFMPAFMILAAMPDTRERETRTRVQSVMIAWVFVVVLVQVAWAIAAMGR